MSSTIIVNRSNITDSTNNSIFKYNFDSPTELTGKEIALVSTSLIYSWRNITEVSELGRGCPPCISPVFLHVPPLYTSKRNHTSTTRT